MKPFAITLISLSLLLAGGSTWAENIIGSVDEKGSVTFSDHVPAGAVQTREVEVDPIYPSEEGQETTRAITQQMIDAADQSRQGTEDVRKAREELVEKRRSSLEANQPRSQEATAVPPGGRSVIDRGGYVKDQGAGYVKDRGPGYVKEQGPGYVREQEPKYIE